MKSQAMVFQLSLTTKLSPVSGFRHFFKHNFNFSTNVKRINMSSDITEIGAQKVKSVANGEVVELKSFWENQNVAIIFFRRWGCMFCRLWAKELSDIKPVLDKHNIKMIGIGVEEAGSKDFVDGKYFDGDLYYVENISTYQLLGFKRFNLVTILTSLFWKQSREAMAKGKAMGLENDLIGDGLQNGGAYLMREGGKTIHKFVQMAPADYIAGYHLLKHFGLENEYNPETMANKKPEPTECTTEAKP